MYRREFFILTVLALLAVGLVAGATTVLIHRLNNAVNEVAEITLPDFLSIGLLNQKLLENWSKVLLIQQATSPENRLRMIQEIKQNSTDAQIAAFQKTPTLPEQETVLTELLATRNRFIEKRACYFELVQKGDMDAARVYLNDSLMPEFKLYRASAEGLNDATAEIGKVRAQRVVEVSRTVVVGAGLLTVVVFIAGFFVGFHTLFRGLAWANRIARSSGAKRPA